MTGSSPLLADKPVGFSSFQIVRLLQRTFKKVGHAGTLDPFASGLLIILVDRATREFDSFQRMDKEYTGEILLGFSTDTYDITGTVSGPARTVAAGIDFDRLQEAAREFTGVIEQVPPRFSALKQQGRRLYDLSRQHEPFEIVARRVAVKSFEIQEFDRPVVRFRAVVGQGTYLRSLAHDLGQRLGCGATLMSLRRTRIGEHRVEQALRLGDILEMIRC